MHYAQTTDESVCCQIFPGMLQEENNAQFDISDGSFWGKPNPWQIIFDGYKSGIKPGKQVSQPFLFKKGCWRSYEIPFPFSRLSPLTCVQNEFVR